MDSRKFLVIVCALLCLITVLAPMVTPAFADPDPGSLPPLGGKAPAQDPPTIVQVIIMLLNL
jgi:hypothetical protein